MTPRARRRDELRLVVTQIDSGLVRELDCVESRALVRSGRWHPRGLLKKRTEQPCRDLAHAVARPVKREE